MTDPTEREPDLPGLDDGPEEGGGLSPNDADREGAEESGAGYGNHAPPEGEPGDTCRDGE